VDPLAELDFEDFQVWMANPEQVKVTHAGFEDLELFAHHFATQPSPWFDTQLAWACLGGPLSIGLDGLVQAFGHAPLDKSKSRNDWTRRPLAQDLLDYAAQDVVHLPAIARELRQQLIDQDRLSWLMEEQAAVLERIQGLLSNAFDPMDRVKGLHNLSGQGMATMRAMVGWRDETARSQNQARSRIVRDELLLNLADCERWPDLSTLPGYRGGATRRHADALRERFEAGRAGPAEDALPKPSRPSPAQKKANQAMKAAVNACAERHALAPEFLARRKDIEAWAGGKSGPQGWRKALLKEWI
ncbi:MAG: ribonuclease D, partial [Litorivicinus sp.]